MRVSLRSVMAVISVGAVIFACGSSDQSTFNGNGTGNDGGVVEPPPGTFIPDDAGNVTPTTCKPLTCADANANCGPIGDGCGGVVQCGACTGAESCGGGGVPSQCGKPSCTPTTCAAQGANCGAAADGCGGIIASCGTCDTAAGEFCGGGGASKCGLGSGGGDGGVDGGGACVPATCADLGANCGQQADGCGGLINCYPGGGTTCAGAGETCGGGGTPNQCGKACTPKTTCPAGQNCGVIADGCGGVVSCWPAGTTTCATGTCGGGGTANVCGSSTTCTGLCTQQTTCPGGGTTSVSGTVTTPNGTLPIYGALVFVPTTTPTAFTTGVSCDQCSAGGTALVQATTGPDGKFLLSNMPVSSTAMGKVNDIPIVIQLGRWRKQITVQTTSCGNVTIPTVNAAASTTFVGGAARPAPDHTSAALPRNKSEGDIPLTAISTGYIDGLECVFRKIGIDDAEFTNPSGNGRIRFYQDNGAVITAAAGQCSVSASSCTNFGSNCPSTCSGDGRTCTTAGSACGYCSGRTTQTCTNIGGNCPNNRGTCTANGTCTSAGVCNQTAGTPAASTLYNDPTELAKYDISLFECVGSRVDKTATQQANVRNYANNGGRVYATHFSYVWAYNDAVWGNGAPTPVAPWNNGAASWNSAIATLDVSFAKGQAFAQWLNIVGGLNNALPAGGPPWAAQPPKITIQDPRHDVDNPPNAPAQRWLYTTAADNPTLTAPDSLQHFTWSTDWTKPAAQQCGRVLYSDFHVSVGSSTQNKVFPAECDTNPLTAQEKVLAFMLFDLASCVSTGAPPTTCTPKSCADQGIQCGQAGDGCGNIINCPNCPMGQTCGGGGTPSVCGASTCTPTTCPAGTCGKMGDGCGGTLDCGNCATGTCGGGGTANMCGMGTCTAGTCPTPAVGSKCGPVADGCGGLLSCQCPAGTACINGTCATSTCVPKTCATAGANCGQIADGCGGLLDCGTCLAPQTCGGGGTPNVCGGGVN
jgi:hypothetical protein